MNYNTYICKVCQEKFSKKTSLKSHMASHSEKWIIKRNKKKLEYQNYIDIQSDLFLNNKYTKIYYQIIRAARKKEYTGYTEKHHIIPRSLGGSNKKENLIILSAREHFLCHYLLTKMIDINTPFYHKIIKAFIIMKAENNKVFRYFNSHLYEVAKEKYSNTQSIKIKGSNNPNYNKKWIVNYKIKENINVPLDNINDYIHKGWKLGRCINFDLYDDNGNRKEKYIKIKVEPIKNKKTKIPIKNKKIPKFVNPNLLPKTKFGVIKIIKKVLNLPENYNVTWNDFHKTKNILIEDLHVKHLSPTDINKIYNLGFKYPSNHISKPFNIKLKPLKDSIVGFYNKKRA